MIILRAAAYGMCFGVRDALDLAHSTESPQDVTIHGQLVHNEDVLQQLMTRGFVMNDEGSRADLPETPRVMITAHGISDRERTRLTQAGKTLIDTTCPLVRRVHTAAQELQAAGYFVIVVGKPRHVEVEGIVGDLHDYAVISNPSEARDFSAPRLGIVFQTTTQRDEAQRIVAAIESANPGKKIRTVMTICRPTLDRQAAARSLLTRVQALVVVGGKHSNNTQQLVAMARAQNKPALHIQSASHLDPDWFIPFDVVGLTAGTSTPDEVIESVHQRMRAIGAQQSHHARATA